MMQRLPDFPFRGLPGAMILALALAACAPQPGPCNSTATRDLRTLDMLIAESRENLARGYAIGRGSGRGNPSVNLCVGNASHNVGVSFCSGGSPGYRSGPVAIDLDEERAKLESMLRQRTELARRAAADAAACTSARG